MQNISKLLYILFFILLKGEGVLRNSEATLLFEMSVCPYESFFFIKRDFFGACLKINC